MFLRPKVSADQPHAALQHRTKCRKILSLCIMAASAQSVEYTELMYLNSRQRATLSGLGFSPGVNVMSQKLRGIPPGGILLLTLKDSFLHFSAQCMLTLKF